ncbi:MAG: lipopolysaccharide transport periplasmic protein LptA [Arenicellales bacterium]
MLRDRYLRYSAFALALYVGLQALPARALTSDRGKPATIEADQVEFDFRTGQRTYKGNVVVVQGTLKVTGDKLVVQYDNNNQQIQTATSWGTPATFKQRPDGKKADVYGEGNTIVLDETKNTLTLIDNAMLKQAGDTAKGKQIVYHMDTDKMTVQGAPQQKQTGGTTATGTQTKPGRARVVILPDQQPNGGKAPAAGTSSSTSTSTSTTTPSTGSKTKKTGKKKKK